jgi:hypothetical protein
MNEDELVPPPTGAPTRAWTRIEDYYASLAARLTARRRRDPGSPHIHPEAPRLLLSILPFLVLAALAVFAVAIVIDAWPGRDRPQAQPKPQPRDLGTAPPGWFEEAEPEMRHKH